jgi:hypothetical protein
VAAQKFKFEIETCVEAGVELRRFRWRLKSLDNHEEFPSSCTYATKREALKDAELALKRAGERGRLRP